MELITCSCGRNYNAEALIRCPACRLATRDLIAGIRPNNTSVKVNQDEIPAGWYPDPSGAPADRYWDGQEWGEKTRPQIRRAEPPPLSQYERVNNSSARYEKSIQSNDIDEDSFLANYGGTVAVVLSIIALLASLMGFASTGYRWLAVVPAVGAISLGFRLLSLKPRGSGSGRSAATFGITMSVVALMGPIFQLLSESS